MSLQLLLSSVAMETTTAAEGAGRLESVAALLLGIASVTAGGIALIHTNRGVARNGLVAALTSLVLGMTGAAGSAVLLADSTGAVGTGNGRGGSIVALAVASVGVGVGGFAAIRSRRVGRSVA